MKQPKKVTLFETTSGATVKTLEEWKLQEVCELVGRFSIGDGTPEQRCQTLSRLIVEKSVELIEILSVKDKGRPLNKKDSKPRKPRVVANEPKAA